MSDKQHSWCRLWRRQKKNARFTEWLFAVTAALTGHSWFTATSSWSTMVLIIRMAYPPSSDRKTCHPSSWLDLSRNEPPEWHFHALLKETVVQIVSIHLNYCFAFYWVFYHTRLTFLPLYLRQKLSIVAVQSYHVVVLHEQPHKNHRHYRVSMMRIWSHFVSANHEFHRRQMISSICMRMTTSHQVREPTVLNTNLLPQIVPILHQQAEQNSALIMLVSLCCKSWAVKNTMRSNMRPNDRHLTIRMTLFL